MEDTARNFGLLASRQIGKTRTIARKQFFKRALKGIPQNFTAATKRQARIYINYIKQFSFEEFGVKLTGTDEVVLQLTDKQVPLTVLAPNVAFGQGTTGDITYDEIAWMRRFNEVKKALDQIGGQTRYRRNYITTPSSMAADAYAFLEGVEENGELKPRDENGNILGPSGRVILSRHQCSLPDAIKQGYDLFDWDEIVEENPWPVVEQFYLLKWLNDQDSFFSLKELESNCYISEEQLRDILDPDNPISWGYDPARTRDAASLTGTQYSTKHDLYARYFAKRYHNMASWYQAESIIRQFRKHPTSFFFGIDVDGLGRSVKDDIEIQGHPDGIKMLAIFNAMLKEPLVLEMKRLIERGRYKYLETDNVYTSALLSIKRGLTGSGQKTTFVTDRKGNSHGDDAWSSIYSIYPSMTDYKRLAGRGVIANAARVSMG